MNLLEYQAKELFQQMGIPILPSQRIDHPKDLKGLRIPYPVVLKSQVYTGGRGKAGGIRFAENTIDAIAAAQTIFHLSIKGHYPTVLLAEAKYEPDQELYLAVVLDRSQRRPLLLGSQAGGIEVQAAVRHIQQVVVDEEFSPFYARRLAIKMGLQGDLIELVSGIIEKMYRLFAEKDLDLVEINPLAVSRSGDVMALDGKVTANISALARHPDLAALSEQLPRPRIGASTTLPSEMRLVELDGNIGILCNGAGLAMSTLDLVNQAGGKPANFLNLGGESDYRLPPNLLQERVQQGLDWMMQNADLNVILINLVGSVVPCDQIADVIGVYLNQRRAGQRPTFVMRLVGQNFETAKQSLAALDVSVFDQLDAAIARAVALSKG